MLFTLYKLCNKLKPILYIRCIRCISDNSQTCADCGYKWGKLDLSIREITCLGCGKVQCRDSNASRLIDRIGLGHSHDGAAWTRRCNRSFPLAKKGTSEPNNVW